MLSAATSRARSAVNRFHNLVLDLLTVFGYLLAFQPQRLGLTLHLGIFAGQLLLKALTGFSEEGSGQRLRQPDLVIAVGAMQGSARAKRRRWLL